MYKIWSPSQLSKKDRRHFAAVWKRAKPSAVPAPQPGELVAGTEEDLLPNAASTKGVRSKTYGAIKVHFGKTESSTGRHRESSREKAGLEVQETARTKISII